MCNNMHRTCEFVDHLQHVDCIEHSLYYSPNYHPHNLIHLMKHSPDGVMPSSYDSHHCKRDAAALQLGHCSSREAFSWWGHAIIIWLAPLQARCRCIATRAPQWPPWENMHCNWARLQHTWAANYRTVWTLLGWFWNKFSINSVRILYTSICTSHKKSTPQSSASCRKWFFLSEAWI